MHIAPSLSPDEAALLKVYRLLRDDPATKDLLNDEPIIEETSRELPLVRGLGVRITFFRP